MIKGEIIHTKDSREFSEQVVNILIRTICDCINEKGQCFLAISGGSTPIPVFEVLVQKYDQCTYDWSNVHIYFIDERCVPKDHPDNNYKSCYEIWLKYCSKIQSHRIEGWLDPMDAAQKYEEEITSLLDRKNGIPQFDLIFMGMGEDGHIASLFPEYDFEKATVLCVENVHVKSKDIHRVTMTLPVLNNAKKRIIGIVGDKKKKIFNDIMNGNYKDYPVAKLLTSTANDTWVITE